MSLRDEIADQLRDAGDEYTATGEGPNALELADAILTAIVASVPELVWEQELAARVTADARISELEAKLAKADTVQCAAAVILADRWGGYGNRRAMQAMWDFVYKTHNRHMLPMSHYDGVLQAGLRALAKEPP